MVDVEVQISMEPAAVIAVLDAARVVLRRDEPDAGTGDDDVADAAARSRDAAVAQHGRARGRQPFEVDLRRCHCFKDRRVNP